jgi:hypothetical protein
VDGVEAIIAHCDLSLIFFDHFWNGHLWPTILPHPLILLLSCLVTMVLLITVGLPVLSLMNHPNPLPRMYTSPTHQYFLFTPISYPTRTYSLPLATLSNGLCLSWTTPNVGVTWPPSCVAPLRIRWNTHHSTPFDPTFPSIREHIMVYFFDSHFPPACTYRTPHIA